MRLTWMGFIIATMAFGAGCEPLALPRLGLPCSADADCKQSSLRCQVSCASQGRVCVDPNAPPNCPAESPGDAAQDTPPPPERKVDSAADQAPDQAPCQEGMARACASTPPSPCPGTQLCLNNAWSVCETIAPGPEVCDNKDNDCDGKIDEELDQECYSGPTNTQDRGLCKAGRKTCKAGVWSPCAGEVTPKVDDLCNANTDDNCDGSIQDPHLCEWHRIASSQGGYVQAPQMLVSQSGDIYIAGAYKGATLDLGATVGAGGNKQENIFVARLRPSGAVVWTSITYLQAAFSFRYPGVFRPTSMALDRNNFLYIAGVFGGTFQLTVKGQTDKQTYASKSIQAPFLWKVSIATGKTEWFSFGRSPSASPVGVPTMATVVVDSTGRIFGLGSFNKTLTWDDQTVNSQGGTDLFLVELTSDGKLKKLETFGAKGEDWTAEHGASLALGADDTLFLFGRINQRGDPGDYDVSFGSVTLRSTGKQSFIAARKPDGTYWARSTQGTGIVKATHVLVTSKGELALSGSLFGESTLFDPAKPALSVKNPEQGWVALLDAQGNPLWHTLIDGQGANIILGAKSDDKGALTITGHFATSITFGKSSFPANNGKAGFLARLSPTGAPLWLVPFASTLDAQGAALAHDSRQQIFVIGEYTGNIQLGDKNMPGNEKQSRVFIWKPKTPAPPAP